MNITIKEQDLKRTKRFFSKGGKRKTQK